VVTSDTQRIAEHRKWKEAIKFGARLVTIATIWIEIAVTDRIAVAHIANIGVNDIDEWSERIVKVNVGFNRISLTNLRIAGRNWLERFSSTCAKVWAWWIECSDSSNDVATVWQAFQSSADQTNQLSAQSMTDQMKLVSLITCVKEVHQALTSAETSFEKLRDQGEEIDSAWVRSPIESNEVAAAFFQESILDGCARLWISSFTKSVSINDGWPILVELWVRTEILEAIQRLRYARGLSWAVNRMSVSSKKQFSINNSPKFDFAVPFGIDVQLRPKMSVSFIDRCELEEKLSLLLLLEAINQLTNQ